jgi:hypothetical protein
VVDTQLSLEVWVKVTDMTEHTSLLCFGMNYSSKKRTNKLANYATALLTAVKCFIVLAPGLILFYSGNVLKT